MTNSEFLSKARGRVSILLTDGTTHTGRFREDILSASALSAFFFGDVQNFSLPLDAIERVDSIFEDLKLAS